MASLRSLLRHCARLRSKLTDPNDPLLANLNILIAITGAFFGQVCSRARFAGGSAVLCMASRSRLRHEM